MKNYRPAFELCLVSRVNSSCMHVKTFLVVAVVQVLMQHSEME